jgi:hypothetical protein
VPGGTIGEESSAFPGFEALSHANASPSFGCDMIESPDAARLLEACADWSYHYHVRAVRVFRPSAVVILGFMLCHVLTSSASVKPLVSYALIAPRVLIFPRNICISLLRAVTRRFISMVRTRDLRLAIMPTGSVVCMRRAPMQERRYLPND